jgi:TonB family protein
MHREFAFALLAFLPASFAAGQQAIPPAPTPLTAATPDSSTVYDVESDVTAPQLLPRAPSTGEAQQCKKLDGSIMIGLVVDAQGNPLDIHLFRPGTTDLDKLATSVVEADRFAPGMRNGSPVSVAVRDEVTFETCDEAGRNNSDETLSPSLRSMPLQTFRARDATYGFGTGAYNVGSRISAPVLTHGVTAKFTDEARRAHYQGICVIALIVDAQGNPQNIHVVRTLGMGLDEKAMEAIRKYKFKPALKDGKTPVPVMITVEVDFHLYSR